MTKEKPTKRTTAAAVAGAADCSPPEAIKWLIYDVEWLLEQSNKISVKRNRDVIKRALSYLKHVEANAERSDPAQKGQT
jgi:hypothetical protein